MLYKLFIQFMRFETEALMHPESPGVKVEVTRCWIGRLFKCKKFATLNEVKKASK